MFAAGPASAPPRAPVIPCICICIGPGPENGDTGDVMLRSQLPDGEWPEPMGDVISMCGEGWPGCTLS